MVLFPLFFIIISGFCGSSASFHISSLPGAFLNVLRARQGTKLHEVKMYSAQKKQFWNGEEGSRDELRPGTYGIQNTYIVDTQEAHKKCISTLHGTPCNHCPIFLFESWVVHIKTFLSIPHRPLIVYRKQSLHIFQPRSGMVRWCICYFYNNKSFQLSLLSVLICIYTDCYSKRNLQA